MAIPRITYKETELVHGSGNVFRDFGDPQADLRQAKAVLAARIIAVLDDRGLAVHEAASLTGFAAADLSRIRNADLGRFTLDRLMKILVALGRRRQGHRQGRSVSVGFGCHVEFRLSHPHTFLRDLAGRVVVGHDNLERRQDSAEVGRANAARRLLWAWHSSSTADSATQASRPSEWFLRIDCQASPLTVVDAASLSVRRSRHAPATRPR